MIWNQKKAKIPNSHCPQRTIITVAYEVVYFDHNKLKETDKDLLKDFILKEGRGKNHERENDAESV